MSEKKVDFCSGGIWELKNGKVVSVTRSGAVVDCREGSPSYGKLVGQGGNKEDSNG